MNLMSSIVTNIELHSSARPLPGNREHVTNEKVSGRQEVRVLYDLSVLGMVAEDRRHYTGVQRVAHEVALGLAAIPWVSLSIYGNRSVGLTELFLDQEKRLSEANLVHSSWQRRLGRLALGLETLVQQGRPARWNLPMRAARSLSWRVESGLEQASAAFRRTQLDEFDIYHSPAYAFPDAVRTGTNLCRFMTIYDLSPVKMPQFTTEAIIDTFERMRASTRRDDFFVCISESTKNDWCEVTGADEKHCFVTPLAAAAYFRPCEDSELIAAARERHGIPEWSSYFLSVSTLEPRKNISTVIEAFFAFLRETGRRDFYLVLAGREGWKVESTLLAAETDSELRSHVIFTGYVAEEDLAPLYSGARAFAYLSFYEGFGLPPLEAMQCGTPVICSNTSSLPEVVGDAGMLLRPDDIEGLTNSFSTLAEDNDLCLTMSERSRERAKLFSWSRCVEATVGAYQRALGG